MNEPIRLLFVCLGNICRSPAGENVMRHLLEREGLSSRFVVGEFCEGHDEREVPDPYYGGPEGFEKVLDLLEDGCSFFLRQWRAGELGREG